LSDANGVAIGRDGTPWTGRIEPQLEMTHSAKNTTDRHAAPGSSRARRHRMAKLLEPERTQRKRGAKRLSPAPSPLIEDRQSVARHQRLPAKTLSFPAAPRQPWGLVVALIGTGAAAAGEPWARHRTRSPSPTARGWAALPGRRRGGSLCDEPGRGFRYQDRTIFRLLRQSFRLVRLRMSWPLQTSCCHRRSGWSRMGEAGHPLTVQIRVSPCTKHAAS